VQERVIISYKSLQYGIQRGNFSASDGYICNALYWRKSPSVFLNVTILRTWTRSYYKKEIVACYRREMNLRRQGTKTKLQSSYLKERKRHSQFIMLRKLIVSNGWYRSRHAFLIREFFTYRFEQYVPISLGNQCIIDIRDNIVMIFICIAYTMLIR